MSSWSDTHGPPRKRMRKGTKSCIECRRRKIRCTYTVDHPNVCNECRLRGSKCIDQEHNEDDRGKPSASEPGDQRYSLRERVAHLENVVQDLAKRLDQQSPANNSPVGNQTIASASPSSVESDKLGPSSIQIQNAPVLQLFDNYLVSRQEDLSSNDQFAGIKDMSPKARAVRAELLSLLPPQKDMWRIINEGSKLWCVWEESFPELQKIFEHKWDCNELEGLLAPADIGKAIVCLCMSALQSPTSFDFNSLLVPIDPEEFSVRLTSAVDRLVVRDDDFAATLPGIECQMLLAKFHLNEGRLRKAWLVTRRAIEFAHLAGMHLSTRTRSPMDTLFVRRQKIWCSLNCSDRSLSLILGLPYGVTEANFLPQIEQRLQEQNSPSEEYLLRIGVICGHIVDRNQNPGELCLESTLKLDSELDLAWKSMPSSFFGIKIGPGEAQEQFHARIPLQFMPKVLRALLHLPFMLKYPHEPQFAYSHRMAITSARQGLTIYKILRAMTRSYLCKMIDFLAFTMGMLLIVHLHGDLDESPGHDKEQDEADWKLVGEVVEILHQARKEKGGSVAAESANILGEIYRTRSQRREWTDVTCKITVPYFGTITVGAGAKFSRPQNKEQGGDSANTPSSASLLNKQSPHQLYTPPLSDPEGISGCHSDPVCTDMPVQSTTGAGCPPQALPGDGLASATFPGPELNAFTGLFDDFNQFSWPTPNVDLGLDHGWNLNWFS